jgi:hypothetical protein
MEQTKSEEVKTTGKVATLKQQMATALTRTCFGSREVSAPCELGPPSGRRDRLEDCSTSLVARTKTDPILCTEPPKRV